MNSVPDQSPLVNIYRKLLLCQYQLGCDHTSWLLPSDSPSRLLLLGITCWFRGMLWSASTVSGALWALPFLFFPLPLAVPILLLFIALYYSAMIFIKGQGRKSALPSVRCSINMWPRDSPQPLYVDIRSGQRTGNKLLLFYYLGRRQKWKCCRESPESC